MDDIAILEGLLDWLRKREIKCRDNAVQMAEVGDDDYLSWADMEASYKSRADALGRLLTERANKSCRKCVFWSNDRTVHGLGLCTRALPLWDASTWDNDYNRVLSPEYADRKFFAQDGSDYKAIVLTAPDFFCAEFAPQPTKDTADE